MSTPLGLRARPAVQLRIAIAMEVAFVLAGSAQWVRACARLFGYFPRVVYSAFFRQWVVGLYLGEMKQGDSGRVFSAINLPGCWSKLPSPVTILCHVPRGLSCPRSL